jgi:tetratricopeptide (TPR) repeat protein
VPVQSAGVRSPTSSVNHGGYQSRARVVRARWLIVCILTILSRPDAKAEPAALKQARDHFRLGKEAYAADRFDDAYREFEAGYQLSNRPLFLLNMGHAMRRKGDLPEARTLYRRFLQVQPDSPYRAEVEALLGEIVEVQPPAPPPPPPAVVPPPPPPAMLRASAPPPPPPSPSRWWLWAGAGTVVVAAVVVGVMARSGDSYTKQGSLGTLGAP